MPAAFSLITNVERFLLIVHVMDAMKVIEIYEKNWTELSPDRYCEGGKREKFSE